MLVLITDDVVWRHWITSIRSNVQPLIPSNGLVSTNMTTVPAVYRTVASVFDRVVEQPSVSDAGWSLISAPYVRLSVCLSVCPSVYPAVNSTVRRRRSLFDCIIRAVNQPWRPSPMPRGTMLQTQLNCSRSLWVPADRCGPHTGR